MRITGCGSGVPADALGELFNRSIASTMPVDARRVASVWVAITGRAVRFHGGRVAASNRAEGGLMVDSSSASGGAVAADRAEPVAQAQEV